MSKKIFFVVLAVVAILALTVAPAFAANEGYNSPTQYTRATGYFSGPHGGYTTTTNKCADCHSTHYAAGSFMLLRANSREAACDYCHGGGGGSTINIMMDNDYRTGAYSTSQASAVSTTTAGYGTGHTLGYKGLAPADIEPAFQDTEGLACFDCHSPHGNSDRIMTTMANPGRSMGGGNVVIAPGAPGYIGYSTDGDNLIDAEYEWGIDPVYGNLKFDSNPGTAGGYTAKPIWPAGRFLLLKNPDGETWAGAEVLDTVVALNSEVASQGVNKFKIDWNDPLGPADGSYGGFQDNDNDKNYVFAPNAHGSLAPAATYTTSDPAAGGGFLAVSEFCTDCHDGTGGASTQGAVVWEPATVNGNAVGAYATAYSHDAQPRH